MIQARYTEVLYNLIKNDMTNNAINKAMSTYPLYVSTSKREYGQPNIIPTRDELNKSILSYYKYREIGFETVGRFLDELETALIEIMPYYNQLFYSADQDYNMIYNVDYKRTIDRNLDANNKVNTESTAQDESTTNSETENFGKTIKSLTPQNSLNISNKNIDSVTYGDEASWNKDSATSEANSIGSSESNVNSNAENKENEFTLETTKGNFGVVSAQDLIKKYREIVINIVQQIINDPRITELFMLIY